MNDLIENGAIVDAIVLDGAGATTALRDRLAGRHLLIYFLRTFECPVCRAHVRALRDNARELAQLGADAAIIGPGTAGEAAALRDRFPDLPFPIFADQSGDAYRAAGLRKTLFGAVQTSGAVLLTPAGEPRLVHKAALPFNSLNLGEVLATLRADHREAA